MVTRSRWKHAQEYETDFWDTAAREIESGQASELGWYDWRAGRLEERLNRLDLHHTTDGGAVVLEVGSGPVGVVSFFPAATKFAIDPLQTFYSSHEALTAPRSEDVVYIEGVGESIALADRSCDLVIIENCIDHVQSVEEVMNELTRVLRPGGILYLSVNCRTRLGYYIHRVISRLKLDPGHPHTFTPVRIRKLVAEFGLGVRWFDTESYTASTLSDIKNEGLRGKVKALLGISEFTSYLIAEKSRGSLPSTK